MKIIEFADADLTLSWTQVADALEAGHRASEADIGDLLLSQGDQSFLSRGAWIPGVGLALKSVTVFPDNPQKSTPLPSVQGGMLLFDGVSGALIALIDGPLVTKWKTAGDSVLGARLLANPNPTNLLIVGAGTVAQSLVEAYSEIFPSLTRISLWNRTGEKAEHLAVKLSDQGYPVHVVKDLSVEAGAADIISTATMSKDPVLKGTWIKPGTHIDLIGAYRPDMREADDELIKKAKIFVDSRHTAIDDIGELAIPLEKNVISRDQIQGDLYDLCAGKTGRSSPEEITLYKNGGGAHLDLMTGRVIYEVVSS